MIMVSMWLRAFGIETNIAFQTDWGQEFGGDNPDTVQELSDRFLAPVDAQLRRYPKGRKQYNGRVERSHRTDDEEFYRPYLLKASGPDHLLAYCQRWVYFYNVLRPHYGEGMKRQPPLNNLYRLGYDGDPMIALLPPALLDPVSSNLLLDCEPPPGNDLLANYKDRHVHRVGDNFEAVGAWILTRTASSCRRISRVLISRPSQSPEDLVAMSWRKY